MATINTISASQFVAGSLLQSLATKNTDEVKSYPKTKLALPDGKEIEVQVDENRLRCIVYDTEIQAVRNVESFLNYAMNNPQVLKRLIQNATWALLHSEKQLENWYKNSRSNRHVRRVTYATSDSKLILGIGVYEIPISTLVQHTLNWLKGIVIEKHGIDGIRLIKEAEKEGQLKLLGELNDIRLSYVEEGESDGLASNG